MLLSLKTKIFANISLIAITILAIFFFITHPILGGIKSLSQEIYQYRLYLEKLYLEGQLLKNIVKELKEVEPSLEKLSKALIEKNEELNFITSLEKLAGDSQLTQNLRINSAHQIDKINYKILPIQIVLEGDFHQLIGYLINMDKIDYYINIKNLSISKKGDSSKINISIEANTYWEK